jgi:hypothetical protein
VDTQPFLVNTIDIACKKILVRPEMANKGKSKDIIIGNPRMSNISQKEIARKAPDDKAKKFGGTGGQTQLMSQARQSGLSIMDGLAHTCGWSGAQIDGPVLRQTVRLTLPDSPPMAKGVSLHTKL